MTVCSLTSTQWRDEQELCEAVKTWATTMCVYAPKSCAPEFVIVHERVPTVASNYGSLQILYGCLLPAWLDCEEALKTISQHP